MVTICITISSSQNIFSYYISLWNSWIYPIHIHYIGGQVIVHIVLSSSGHFGDCVSSSTMVGVSDHDESPSQGNNAGKPFMVHKNELSNDLMENHFSIIDDGNKNQSEKSGIFLLNGNGIDIVEAVAMDLF